ncbi:gliding motility protein GldM [Segetibacter koreensis]|uniref:type IX secretion system motor protein PorM/GldM n=1 Tax=Segetibacter koreensis TaxID=398037 RepID=UPI0003787BEC|nr:gliding motility protein GldM [Segetibacter koreensis]
MALPKEPRQKMINMMYLVLTAMLALNVSAEILNAFRTVNQSLANANEIIELKNQGLFGSFERKAADPKTAEKAKIWQAKALQAKGYADNLYNYIETLKTELMVAAGQKQPGGDYKEDNLEAPTRLLVEGTKGKDLYQKLEQYKANLLGIDKDINKEFEKTLPIDLKIPKSNNQGNKQWEAAYFRMTPTIASITMLSKFQNDVRNSEAQVVDYCHRQIGAVEVVYDEFQAFAGTNSQYLMPGQELVITAGVGAFSKASKPTVTVDGTGVGLNPEGVAEFKTTVGGPGTYTKIVNITFTKPDGTKATIPKKVEYTVGSPTGASVSADAVKVLYIGLDNPLTISGGSAGAEKTQASITNGSLKSLGGGKYVANVTTPGKATINVTVEGKTTPFEFRVKRVPDPVAMIGQSSGGRIATNALKAQQGVRADLRDFVFEGVKFDIVSYVFYATGNGFAEGPGVSQNSGPYFNADSKRFLEKCRPGSTVVIDEIKARGPGGDIRVLPTMAFNLF